MQAFLQGLYDKDQIYQGVYEGPYCVHCEEFKLPGDLMEGEGEYAGQQVCAIHGRPVEYLSETNWFFRLSNYADALLEHYAAHPEAVEPASARNEVLSFIRSGLTDLSISRSTFDWGIKVPWDPDQVVYVWFDALLNYATAVGLGDPEGLTVLHSSHRRSRPMCISSARTSFASMPSSGRRCCLRPACRLPGKVFAHGWLLVGGEKMSKSKLTAIAPEQITDHFGVDAFRWYFLRAIQFGQDGSFSWEDMGARYTAELANGLGNLVSRVTAMTGRYFDGVLPAAEDVTAAEEAVAAAAAAAVQAADERFLASGLLRGTRGRSATLSVS